MIQDIMVEIEAFAMANSVFKSKKAQKVFLEKVEYILKQNIVEVENKTSRVGRQDIVRPNPNPSGRAHVVMTEGESAKGDDVHNAFHAKAQNRDKGVNSW